MKKIYKIGIKSILTGIFLGVLFLLKATPEENFQKGNEAFQAENYEGAIQFYENILSSNQHSLEVYFNLGNAYFENENLGKAILNYERALKLSNKNEALIENLKIARANISDEIEPLSPFFVVEFFRNIRDTFSTFGWGVLSLFGLWLGLGILIFKNLGLRNPIKERFRKSLTVLGLGVAAFCLAFGFAKNYHDKNNKEAIILAKKTALKEAADNSSADFISLHEGTKVELVDKIGDWLKVRLADGDEGWLNKKDLEVI